MTSCDKPPGALPVCVVWEGSTMPQNVVTAAMVAIGDELLSGRTKDKNIAHLARHAHGIRHRSPGGADRR